MLWIVVTLEGKLNSVKGRRSPYKIKEHDQLTMKDTFWVWCRRILGTSQLVMMFCGIGWSMTSPIQIFEFISSSERSRWVGYNINGTIP